MNLNTMSLDDLIGNLETYELKLNQDRLDSHIVKSKKIKNRLLKITHKQDVEEDDITLLTWHF